MFKSLMKLVLYPPAGVLLLLISGIGVMEFFDLIWRTDVYRVSQLDDEGAVYMSAAINTTVGVQPLPGHWSILDGDYEQLSSKLIRRPNRTDTASV